MGEDPTTISQIDHNFHPELTRRWSGWLANGLKVEDKEKILKKYSRKGSCALEAPTVNKELIKAIPEATLKRDEHFRYTQNSVGSALSALGSAISSLLSEDDEEVDKLALLEKLFDAGKMLTDIFHAQSKARKVYISPTLAAIKPLLDKATTDEFLYGSKMGENIKEDKALEKLTQSFKASKAQQKTGSENKEGPLATHKQVGQTQKFNPKRTMRFRYPAKESWKSNHNRRPYQRTQYQSTSQQSASSNRSSKMKK